MTTREVSWDRLDELVPDESRPLLAAHARIPEDRARGLADNPRRARRHRAGRPARRADQGRSGAAGRPPDGPVIAAGSTGSMPATAELIATIAELPARRRGAARPRYRSRCGLLGADRRRRDDGREPRPRSVIRNSPCRRCCAGSASRARRSSPSASPPRMGASASSPRRCGRRPPPTAGEQLAGSDFAARDRRRARDVVRHRSRQCRGGSARHRGRAARGGRDARQDRGPGHARPRAGAPRARRARALEGGGRRFRRRCARRHAGRHIRAAGGGGGARRAVRRCACSPCSSIRCAARRAREGAHCARDRGAGEGACCAARARAGHRRVSRTRSTTFRAELAKLRRGEPSDLHRSDPRADLSRGGARCRRRPRRLVDAALAPLEPPAAARRFAEIAALHRDAGRRAERR